MKCRSCSRPAEPGRKRCRVCLDSNARSNKKWNEAHPEYARGYAKQRYRENADYRQAIRRKVLEYSQKNQKYGFGSWKNMLDRCRNPANAIYQNYGGRGLFVCQGLETWEGFKLIMGRRPKGHSIDRMDNDGSYTCGACTGCLERGMQKNVRWATAQQQALNQHERRPAREVFYLERMAILDAYAAGADFADLATRFHRSSTVVARILHGKGAEHAVALRDWEADHGPMKYRPRGRPRTIET